MKKISGIILILALTGITCLTIFTLTHKNIRSEEKKTSSKTIEKISTNITKNEMSEIYNVELNNKRRKLKTTYQVTFRDNMASMKLIIYLDGYKILEKDIAANIPANSMETLINNETVANYIQLSESSIEIISSDSEYLLLSIYSNLDNLKEEYYVWNNDGELLIKDLLAYDESKVYTSSEALNFFYDSSRQQLAKVEDNKIYALEEKEEDGLILEEMVYEIKENEVSKEQINIYQNIEIIKNNVN